MKVIFNNKYIMNKQLELQLDFQKLTGQKDFSLNRTPTVEERKLRLQLALEELCELADAYGLKHMFNQFLYDCFETEVYKNRGKSRIDTEIYNETEALDAVIDIAVINNGTIICQGQHTIFDKEYVNIDTNNKTKFHKTNAEALQTQFHYSNKQ